MTEQRNTTIDLFTSPNRAGPYFNQYISTCPHGNSEGGSLMDEYLDSIKPLPYAKPTMQTVGHLSEIKKTTRVPEISYQKEFERYKDTLDLLLPIFLHGDPYLVGYIPRDILFNSN